MERTAIEFIRVFLELKHRIRLDNTWANNLTGSNSITILYKQFLALSKQLEIPIAQLWAPEAIRFIESGQFLKERPVEEYALLLQELELYEPALEEYTLWKRAAFKNWQLTNLFTELLDFKLATDFRYFGALEGIEVGGAYAHLLKMNAFNREAVSKIDYLLAGLIDPKRTELDLALLRKDFSYPTADYESKYLDERIEEELT